MALKIVLDEVRRLSQEEGMNDSEIANEIGISRITVNRIRKENNIPVANLLNKKDKSYVCGKCSEVIYIRRRETRKCLCPKCEGVQ